MGNKQLKTHHVILSNDGSIQSQSTTLTGALSRGSSLDSCMVDSPTTRSLPATVSANAYTMKSALGKMLKNSSSRPCKGRITFSNYIFEQSTLGRNEISEDEFNAYWFREDEYAAISKRKKATAEKYYYVILFLLETNSSGIMLSILFTIT